MAQKRKKTSILSRLRNYFFAGAVVLIPIGITIYLSIFIIKVSSKLLPKELNPNHYLKFDIPGIEIFIALVIITFIGWLSLSFLGKKIIELINNILKKMDMSKIDYVFLDGGHDYLTVKNDLNFCKEVVVNGGIVLCDDYDLSYAPGVKKAIDEFININSFKCLILCNDRFAKIEKK